MQPPCRLRPGHLPPLPSAIVNSFFTALAFTLHPPENTPVSTIKAPFTPFPSTTSPVLRFKDSVCNFPQFPPFQGPLQRLNPHHLRPRQIRGRFSSSRRRGHRVLSGPRISRPQHPMRPKRLRGRPSLQQQYGILVPAPGHQHQDPVERTAQDLIEGVSCPLPN